MVLRYHGGQARLLQRQSLDVRLRAAAQLTCIIPRQTSSGDADISEATLRRLRDLANDVLPFLSEGAPDHERLRAAYAASTVQTRDGYPVMEPGMSVFAPVFEEECKEARGTLADFVKGGGKDASLTSVVWVALALVLQRTIVLVNEPKPGPDVSENEWVRERVGGHHVPCSAPASATRSLSSTLGGTLSLVIPSCPSFRGLPSAQRPRRRWPQRRRRSLRARAFMRLCVGALR